MSPNKLMKRATTALVRAAAQAIATDRLDRIRNFEAHHDLWRQRNGYPPLVRNAAGFPIGVFTMGVRRG